MVICEGPTEEGFVKACLIDHLAGHGIDTSVSLLRSGVGQRGGGDVSLPRLASHVRNVYHSFDYVTTLIDYYGFRGHARQTKTELEQSILEAAAARLSSGASAERLLPYVQMHEFEALLFSDTSKFSLDDSWAEKSPVSGPVAAYLSWGRIFASACCMPTSAFSIEPKSGIGASGWQ